MINLIVEPRITKTWEQFCKEAPSYSIALDGYVSGPPEYSDLGPHINFNHHEGVDRLATSSTSQQVYIYTKQGLFKRFQLGGLPYANVYVNDPDQDTSLSVFLLNKHERIIGQKSEPLINRLVSAEDMLDRTAGAYPYDTNSDLMRDITWIFEPYTSVLDRLHEMNGPQTLLVIESIEERIDRYTLGRGEKRIPDARFERLYEGNGWMMIKEIGNYARTELFNLGIHAFVSFKGESPKHVYRYSIGKMTPFIRFPITKLYEELNQREGISEDVNDKWGGSNIIGGSPRQKGSSINSGQLASIIEEFLNNNA